MAIGSAAHWGIGQKEREQRRDPARRAQRAARSDRGRLRARADPDRRAVAAMIIQQHDPARASSAGDYAGRDQGRRRRDHRAAAGAARGGRAAARSRPQQAQQAAAASGERRLDLPARSSGSSSSLVRHPADAARRLGAAYRGGGGAAAPIVLWGPGLGGWSGRLGRAAAAAAGAAAAAAAGGGGGGGFPAAAARSAAAARRGDGDAATEQRTMSWSPRRWPRPSATSDGEIVTIVAAALRRLSRRRGCIMRCWRCCSCRP